LIKKWVDNPVRGSHVEFEQYDKILKAFDKALETDFIDYDSINTLLYEITSPQFKYPNIKKCCEACTAEEKNIQWRRAIDQLKKIEGVTDPDEIRRIYETARLNLLLGEGYFV